MASSEIFPSGATAAGRSLLPGPSSDGSEAALVWYGGFGSNLDDRRFDVYLQGGVRPGLNRVQVGSRDRSAARRRAVCVAPGAVRFAGDFPVWGSGGGAAFFSPDATRTAVLRAALISSHQMADLVLQENGLSPHELPDLAESVEQQLLGLVASAPASPPPGLVATLRVAGLPEGSEYDALHLLSACGLDGRRYDLMVLGTSVVHLRNDPPAEYLGVLRAGLTGSCGLSPAVADAYLAACLANP